MHLINQATCLSAPLFPPPRRCTPIHTDLGQAARIALGKFEVILRQDCLSTDLALLRPYLGPDDKAAAAGTSRYRDERKHSLPGVLRPCWRVFCTSSCTIVPCNDAYMHGGAFGRTLYCYIAATRTAAVADGCAFFKALASSLPPPVFFSANLCG